jgi:hypothetical protein
MVLAMGALLVALTGTATAAGVLVTSKQIKDGTIQTVDISKAAQAQLKRTSSSANSVEGSWMITVNRVNPPPGGPATFASLMTFAAGGGLVETSSTGTSRRGPAHGVWEHVSGRLYATTMVLFRFDASTGAFLGTQKINRTMRLSEDGQTFEGVSLGTQFDAAGNVVLGGLRATETGQRIDVERIADQP